MTAYGAVISLKNTINYILHSSHFTLADEASLQIIQAAFSELKPLKKILRRLDKTSPSRSRKKVNDVDERIKEKIWELEDKLESLLYQQIHSQVDGNGGMEELLFSIDLHSLQDDVASFIQKLKDMKKEHIYELDNMPQDEEEDGDDDIEEFDQMIGLSDQFEKVKIHLTLRYRRKHLHALVGMAGIGKTALARKIYEDPEISTFFDHRAWFKVGRSPKLNQLCGNEMMDEERLRGKRWLVVLDDVWETEVLKSLIGSIPEMANGLVQILVTARQRDVISYLGFYDLVRFLNEGESKELLCQKVFGDHKLCPPQLDKAAAKIAKKCEGLPLLIVAVADILSESQNTEPEYWEDVAEERNSVFTDAHNHIAKVLFPSYEYLPQRLKMPFLYMGVFPSNYETSPSKLINMLTAEGWFLDMYKTRYSKEYWVWKCLEELCTNKNLVLFKRKSIFWNEMKVSDIMFKTCRLHSSWRHVCRGEASKRKFYHVLNRLVDAEEVIKGQHGLCLQNNILFGIKEFRNYVRLSCASFARSVFFFGPYQQYAIPIDVGFKLLRELDALSQRFYSFPTDVLTLVQLKYLALTCNGELPATISKLFNLRVLIIHPHMSIKRCGDPSFVPIQIWDMQKLEHIEILGKSLVPPNHVTSLEKLSTLVGVNANIGTISDLSKLIPKIGKVGVRIELAPYDNHNDLLSCFGCISTLESLRTLKCSIINPVVKSGYTVLATPPRSLMFPNGLVKLHLSGMGFPWEYTNVIGSLPALQVLKLRSYAFMGSNWEAQEDSFRRLEFLLIEDSDLVQWIPRSGSFPELSYLSMKHCYKLKVIDWRPVSIDRKIELVDCNPLALTCAKQLQLSMHTHLYGTASSSFGDKPITVELQRYNGYLGRLQRRKLQTPRSPSSYL